MAQIGDKVKIVSQSWGHGFEIGDVVTIIGKGDFMDFLAQDERGNVWWIDNPEYQEITISKQKTDNNMKLMKKAVLDTATRLAKANNTVTTLEIKVELRKTHPYFHWIQNSRNGLTGVSEYMDELTQEGNFTYTDNGTYRIYSVMTQPSVPKIPKKVLMATLPTGKVERISSKKAKELMANNKGHFFTASFIKKDGTLRTINCQFMKGQDMATPYIKVKEAIKMKMNDTDNIRQINLNTLKTLRIAGHNYLIRK